MTRAIRVAGAQMGPTQRADPRGQTLARMIRLLAGASGGGDSGRFPGTRLYDILSPLAD
jgi:hypothetical protein